MTFTPRLLTVLYYPDNVLVVPTTHLSVDAVDGSRLRYYGRTSDVHTGIDVEPDVVWT